MINLNAPFLREDGRTVSQVWAAFLSDLAQSNNVVVSFNGRMGTVRLAGSDVTQALGFTPISTASPAFTGTPTTPTAALGTNTAQIASCAFVIANLPAPVSVGAWKTPTLLNSWADYGAPFAPTGYCVDTLGIVRLRGVVKSGTVGASTPIFTLPSGFIPPYESMFAVQSSGAIGRVDIDASGNVIVYVGNNAYVSLDGISFRNA